MLMDQARRRQTLPVWVDPFCTRHCLVLFARCGLESAGLMGHGFLETRLFNQQEVADHVSSGCPQILSQPSRVQDVIWICSELVDTLCLFIRLRESQTHQDLEFYPEQFVHQDNKRTYQTREVFVWYKTCLFGGLDLSQTDGTLLWVRSPVSHQTSGSRRGTRVDSAVEIYDHP